MKVQSKTRFAGLGLLTVFLLSACNNDGKQTTTQSDAQVKSATSTAAKEETKGQQQQAPARPEDGPAIATITAPAYTVKLHRAIPFVPANDGVGMMKIKPGLRYVVLDMSVRNTSKNTDVDMGQILLSTKVSDDQGKEYRMNAMAIAAYTLNNPNPHHQAQYNAMWDKLKPGDFYRTTVFGLEAPEEVKKFVISMKEDGNLLKESKRYEAKFSIE